MRRASLLWLLWIFVHVAPAGAQSLVVESLYDANSRLPTTLIPLRLSGDLINAGGNVLAVNVTNTAGADCRVMKDPFLPNIYLLKCNAPTDASVQFQVSSGTQLHQHSYGPLKVQLPAGTVIIEPTGPNPEVLEGRQLYTAKGCIGCHTDPTAKAGKDATAITNAINKQPDIGMAFYKNPPVLSDADIRKIAAYLKSL